MVKCYLLSESVRVIGPDDRAVMLGGILINLLWLKCIVKEINLWNFLQFVYSTT